MGYIKKLKNNELVGGTDKTTIYPVTSTEAVFEEITEGNESSFKSQKFLNNNITGDRINEGTITDYNIATGTITKGKLSSQVQTMIDEGQKKALTPKGNYNPETEYEALDLVFDPVTNSSYISLQTPNVGHPVDENAEGYEEGWWEKTLDGTAVNTAQAAINNKVDQLNTQVNNAIGQANQDIQDLIDASQEALQAATDEANDAAGEARDAVSTVETLTSQQVADAQIGYFTCTNAAASGAAANETKITTTDTIGESHYVKTIGSHVKVKMAAANTHAAPVYLQFGSNTATRSQVYYNGAAVDASNSWEENEVISVYFDGTNYQASNAQGGGGKFATGEAVKNTGITNSFEQGADNELLTKQAMSDVLYGTETITETLTPTEVVMQGNNRLRIDYVGIIKKGDAISFVGNGYEAYIGVVNSAGTSWEEIISDYTTSFEGVYRSGNSRRFRFLVRKVGDANFSKDDALNNITYSITREIGESGLIPSVEDLYAKIGYYECNSLGTDATKVTTTGTVGESTYVLTQNGGQMKIRMKEANSVDSNVKLQIGNTTALPLYYNGLPVSTSNSWEEGEVISVYFDGTNYQASNAQGGGGKAEKIKYDNSQSGLAAENVQEALDEMDDELTELAGKTRKLDGLTEEIPVSYTEGNYIESSGNLKRNESWMVSDFLDISAVAAGDTFVWSGISKLPAACIAFCDEDGTLMHAFSATGSSRTITITNDDTAIGATKVRASFLIDGTPSLTHNGANVLNNNAHYSIRGIQEIEEELDSLHHIIPSETESQSLNNSEFVQGTNDTSGNIRASTNRCITQELYDVDENTIIEVVNNGQAHLMLTYDADGTFRGVTTGWVTTDATYTFDAPHKVRFLVSWDKSVTARAITPNQIEVVFTLTKRLKLVEIIDDEIDAKVGKALIDDNDSFCRYNKKIKVYNPYKDHPTNQYKGQMHCHTTNSDGGLAPAAVVAKYVGYGYDFMTITDHNYITPNPSPNADIVWMGDSYEDTRNSAGYQHMNVWNCSEVINMTSQHQTTNTPQSLVNHYVKDGDSVLSYNHPEYPPVYASDSTLENLPNGISFVEIYNSTIQTYIGEVNSLPTTANFKDMVAYNGTRYINNSNKKNSPNWQETTAEANPDGNLDRGFRIMLDSGKKVFCDAVDDFHRGDNMENRGWQMVFAHSRTRQSIWNGLLMGSSYASTGVYLNDVSFIDGVFKLDIADGANAVTTFYGYNNEVLGTANGATAMYEVTGDEKYVRAMVEIDGKKAWTQPIWVIAVGEQYEF